MSEYIVVPDNIYSWIRRRRVAASRLSTGTRKHFPFVAEATPTALPAPVVPSSSKQEMIHVLRPFFRLSERRRVEDFHFDSDNNLRRLLLDRTLGALRPKLVNSIRSAFRGRFSSNFKGDFILNYYSARRVFFNEI